MNGVRVRLTIGLGRILRWWGFVATNGLAGVHSLLLSFKLIWSSSVLQLWKQILMLGCFPSSRLLSRNSLGKI